MTVFKRLSYSNQEGTAIVAERLDGSIKVIEQGNIDLWSAATQGLFGEVEEYVPLPEDPIEDLIEQAKNSVDKSVGSFRRQLITEIPGQQMVYLRKQHVAEQFLAADNPDPEQFPRIMAAVGVVADTPREVAEVWVAKASEWEQVDILIESRREIFKKRLSESSSKEEIDDIMNEFKEWSI